MQPLMTANGICKYYKMGDVIVEALKDVSFDIFEGEFIVVLGPSGSGKSTLLNIIGGMDGASDGELFCDSIILHNANEKALTEYRRNSVGFVFQFYNLIPNLTAFENVKLSADISKTPLDSATALEIVELSDRMEHFPSQMSGGQQQRVAIARAIVKNPKILLCDEPTGALDYSTGLSVLKILKDFNQKFNKTVIIITHNAGIAEIADRVFYIKDGTLSKIVKNDNPLSPEEVSW